MIVPGKDDNYPGGNWGGPQTGQMAVPMPHGLFGVAIAALVLILAWHLLAGKPRRRR